MLWLRAPPLLIERSLASRRQGGKLSDDQDRAQTLTYV